MHASGPPTEPMLAAHRRARSDPLDFLPILRKQLAEHSADSVAGQRDASTSASPASSPRSTSDSLPPQLEGGVQLVGDGRGSHLLSLEPEAARFDPALETALEGEGMYKSTAPNFSKKDVPMWAVEEDLLILRLVEKHGKRWSKIASHLPGRTDNGVRNRWNRMERAQVMKQRRAPGAGYRCRRCGEPKRGHICAARTLTDEVLEGQALTEKAAALTELSALKLQTSPSIPPTLVPAPPPFVAALPPQAAPPMPPHAAAAPPLASAPAILSAAAPLPTANAMPMAAPLAAPGAMAYAPPPAGPPLAAPPAPIDASGAAVGVDVDDFLFELCAALESPSPQRAPAAASLAAAPPAPPAAGPAGELPPPLFSQQSLQDALAAAMAEPGLLSAF